MGKIKYQQEINLFFQKTPVVSSRDIRTFVRKRHYSYLLASNLIKRGKINRIVKGFYTTHNDPIVSVFCFKPSYIGLQEALSLYGLWEQETNVVIVTAKKAKKQLIRVFGNNVVLHRIKPNYLFGYNLVKHEGFYIPVSDFEKTLIDFVYFNEIPDRKIIRQLKKKIKITKLTAYL